MKLLSLRPLPIHLLLLTATDQATIGTRLIVNTISTRGAVSVLSRPPEMASTQAPAAADNVDPVYEWLDDGASYLLRLDLPGEVTVRVSLSLGRQLS